MTILSPELVEKAARALLDLLCEERGMAYDPERVDVSAYRNRAHAALSAVFPDIIAACAKIAAAYPECECGCGEAIAGKIRAISGGVDGL